MHYLYPQVNPPNAFAHPQRICKVFFHVLISSCEVLIAWRENGLNKKWKMRVSFKNDQRHTADLGKIKMSLFYMASAHLDPIQRAPVSNH